MQLSTVIESLRKAALLLCDESHAPSREVQNYVSDRIENALKNSTFLDMHERGQVQEKIDDLHLLLREVNKPQVGKGTSYFPLRERRHTWKVSYVYRRNGSRMRVRLRKVSRRESNVLPVCPKGRFLIVRRYVMKRSRPARVAIH